MPINGRHGEREIMYLFTIFCSALIRGGDVVGFAAEKRAARIDIVKGNGALRSLSNQKHSSRAKSSIFNEFFNNT